MYADLHPLEVLTYGIIWIGGIVKSTYSVFTKRDYIRRHSSDIYFDSGWKLVKNERDITDYEWEIWLPFMTVVSPWILAHLIGSWLIRPLAIQLIPLWHLTVTGIFLNWFVGSTATAFLFVQPCVFYILSAARSKALLWVFSAGMLGWIHGDEALMWLQLPFNVEFLLHAALGWTHIRCLSFTLDKVDQNKHAFNLIDFVSLLGYCFYLPTLFLGPLILYTEYHKGVTVNSGFWAKKFLQLSFRLLRFVFWLLITDLSLHFVYSNALTQQPQIVKNIDWWTLFGLGYCMGQFFMNKYVVAYGLGGSIAEAEHIAAPQPPKCIARIHLYSEMWRYFDHGLYLFLVKYIYIPFCGKCPNILQKLLASFVCFAFIYLWHNTYNFVLIWSVLNFIGVTVEGMCKSLAGSNTYKKFEEKLLSPRNSRRFKAVISSPLFIMSALSSFYFLGRMEIGNIFVKRILSGPPMVIATLLMFCYCGCQVSMEVRIWEKRREKKTD